MGSNTHPNLYHGFMNIIFDFDGTLFKTETVDVYAFNRALQDMGRETVDDSVILSLIGMPLMQISQMLLQSDDIVMIKRFAELAKHYELEIIPQEAKLYPGVLDLILFLKNAGHTVSICSNGSREYIHAILDHFHIKGLFDMVWHKQDGYSKARAVYEIIKNTQ